MHAATPPSQPAAGTELTPAEQAAMVQALRLALQARHPGPRVELIETHISFVLIAGGHAYKFKKALRPGFLDYSTLALRLHCCHEELRLNRRLAPDLYLDVVAVAGTPDAPVLGGAGPMIDCAVKMRAFAQEGLWDRLAARAALRSAHIDELAGLLCAFHAAAAVADAQGRLGTPAQVRAPMLDNLEALDGLLTQPAERARLQQLRGWEVRAWAALEPVFAQRLAEGRVRECHGDLHLGNVTFIAGRTTVFDGIEFNDDFRWIDVISEVAFMAMDLQAHALHALAHRFVNAYLQGSGDYDGARVLRYYIVHRALVRAKVAAMRAAQPGCEEAAATAAAESVRQFLHLAVQSSQPGHPALMFTHGPSGSGKTSLTQGLLEAAGAIRIRADVERKRLAGLDALARSASPLEAGLYSGESTAATYARLVRLAVPVLQGGYPVILDATFLKRAQRDAARRVAAAQGVAAVLLDFEAAPATLRERVHRRAALAADASEADERVLQMQWRTAEPLQADEGGVVFRCRPLPDAGDAAPQADWGPLLERLGQAGPVPPCERPA
ncbi:MAG: AAA family ATPase [Rubrivivax sp.]|nr:AAA family ATPase [Rubrivivax sp.]